MLLENLNKEFLKVLGKNKHIQDDKIKMLAEALSMANQLAESLGLNIGGEKLNVCQNENKTANVKPEGKREKVDKYMMLLSTGKRMPKAELLKRI